MRNQQTGESMSHYAAHVWNSPDSYGTARYNATDAILDRIDWHSAVIAALVDVAANTDDDADVSNLENCIARHQRSLSRANASLWDLDPDRYEDMYNEDRYAN